MKYICPDQLFVKDLRSLSPPKKIHAGNFSSFFFFLISFLVFFFFFFFFKKHNLKAFFFFQMIIILDQTLFTPESQNPVSNRELIILSGFPKNGIQVEDLITLYLSQGFRKISVRELCSSESCLELCEQALSKGLHVRFIKPLSQPPSSSSSSINSSSILPFSPSSASSSYHHYHQYSFHYLAVLTASDEMSDM
mgnify:CR=1 FL=1